MDDAPSLLAPGNQRGIGRGVEPVDRVAALLLEQVDQREHGGGRRHLRVGHGNIPEPADLRQHLAVGPGPAIQPRGLVGAGRPHVALRLAVELAQAVAQGRGSCQVDFRFRHQRIDPVGDDPELAVGFDAQVAGAGGNQGGDPGALPDQVLLGADAEEAA
jgi:hypothetical protein